MDPTDESEKTPTEPVILRVKSADYVGYDEWNDIRRAVIEQNVPAGTQFVQYKNRVVPLQWEPLPMVSIALPFGTVEEAMDYIRRTCKSTGGETSSDVLNITPSSAQPTSSADNLSSGDIPSGVESAASNLHILDHSTEQNSRAASDFHSPGLVVSEEPAWCNNNVSDNLQKPAEDGNVPSEDDGGHQDITEESPTQEPDWLKKLHSRFEEYKTVPEGSKAEALFSAVKELDIAVAEQNSAFQKMDTAADVSTECGTAERHAGDEMTGSPSAERFVEPANESPILEPSTYEIISCLQGLYARVLQKMKEASGDELEDLQRKARTMLSTLKKFKKCAAIEEENDRILQELNGLRSSISAECGTAERHSGEEMTESPSARRLVGPANESPAQKSDPDEIISRLENLYFRALQNFRKGPDDELGQTQQLARNILSRLIAEEQHCDDENITGSVSARSSGTLMTTEAATKRQKLMDERRIRKVTHRDLRTPGPLIHTPFPKNPSDQKDWPNILRAMRSEGSVSHLTESFRFEGRHVPIGWRTEPLDRLKKRYTSPKDIRRIDLLAKRESDAEIEGGPSTAEASTTKHDEVEEQEQEEECCDDRSIWLANRALDAGMGNDDPSTAGASTSKEEKKDRMVHSDPASSEMEIFYIPYPANPSDQKDWPEILSEMKRENVTIAVDLFYFEGRWVPLVWKIAIYDCVKEEFVPEDFTDTQLAGDPLRAAASTAATVHDTVEEQKQEKKSSTARGQSDSKKKRGPRRRK